MVHWENVLAIKPYDLSSIFRAILVEGENELPRCPLTSTFFPHTLTSCLYPTPYI